MKTASEISIDFSQAVRKAEELEDIARGMRRLAKKELSESLQELSAVWRGEAAEAYLKKGDRLQEKIIASAKDIEKAAAAIRKAAKNTYDAEMRAYALAKQRLQ